MNNTNQSTVVAPKEYSSFSYIGVALFFFLVAFAMGPLQFSEYFTKIPGDLGDARLNAYFLENVYLFFNGASDSLWHFGFYYPFPYVMGFSENLFGLAPIYLLIRELSNDPYSAFLYLFLLGYLLNYLGGLYAFRKMGLSRWASILGALIFAFALPVTARSGHAQLHFRFAMPLAIYFFYSFLKFRDFRALVWGYFWLALQFFVGVYIGFFTFLMLLSMVLCFVVFPYVRERVAIKSVMFSIFESFKALPKVRKAWSLGVLPAISVAMVLLFYPYLQVKSIYGFNREWGEVLGMMPRLYSYIFAPNSLIWDFELSYFQKLPMRWEHQMFPGMVPFALSILAFFIGFSRSAHLAFRLIAASFLLIFSFTLSTGGSWWEYLQGLPLFSAIRAMTRVDMLYLFIYGFLSGYVIDSLLKSSKQRFVAVLALAALFFYESSRVKTSWTPKAIWDEREAKLSSQLPEGLSKGAPVFFAHSGGIKYEHEVTAIWVALRKGYKTLNGYSGNVPYGYHRTYGKDCSEVARRVAAYQSLQKVRALKP